VIGRDSANRAVARARRIAAASSPIIFQPRIDRDNDAKNDKGWQ
jgi:hypothetical protein